MVDGEVLAIKKLTGNKQYPFSLQMIETDRLGTGLTSSLNEFHVDGIDLDTLGRPTHYNFNIINSLQHIKIPANEVIHYFKPTNRTTQYRGISEYKQAIVDLRNLAGYNTSVVKGARARANVAYIVETNDASGHSEGHSGVFANSGGGTQDKHPSLYDISGIAVEYLNRGETMKTLDASTGGSDHSEFMSTSIRLVSSARQVSYELGFRDYSRVNFASARASRIQDDKRFDAEQVSVTHGFNNPVFSAWLEANVLQGNIKGLTAKEFYEEKYNLVPSWIPPRKDGVNPLQDIRTFEKELSLGLTTRGSYVASKGEFQIP